MSAAVRSVSRSVSCRGFASTANPKGCRGRWTDEGGALLHVVALGDSKTGERKKMQLALGLGCFLFLHVC